MEFHKESINSWEFWVRLYFLDIGKNSVLAFFFFFFFEFWWKDERNIFQQKTSKIWRSHLHDLTQQRDAFSFLANFLFLKILAKKA